MKDIKKWLKIGMKVLKAAMIVVFIAFILVVCLQRFTDNKMSLLSFRMFTVISGSMEPKYSIGDVLISKEVEAEDIKVGDAVTYLGTEGDFSGKVVTHEVVEIEIDENNELIFHTKGLANLVEDPEITADQIYGVVIYRSFLLSFIYRIIATKLGFYIFIIIPLLFTIGSEIVGTMLAKEEKRRQALKETKE